MQIEVTDRAIDALVDDLYDPAPADPDPPGAVRHPLPSAIRPCHAGVAGGTERTMFLTCETGAFVVHDKTEPG